MYELVLGFGLLIVRRPAGLWLVTVATFLAFVASNLNAVRVGQASCGCFGSVPVSPWNALLLDVGVLAALAMWAALDRQVRAVRQAIPDAAAFLAGFGLTAAVWLILVPVTFGTTESALAAIRGDEVFLEPAVLDFGAVPAQTAAEEVVVVRNAGAEAVRVIGGTSNCACTLISDLPATVPPGGACRLRVRLAVPAGAGAFQYRAVLWTDSPTNETIPVVLRGRSVGP